MSIELGDTAKDIVTGLDGVVTGKVTYLTGCDQYILQPVVKSGAWSDGKWFDENRLKVVKKGVVKIAKSEDPRQNGGPASNPAPIR